MTGTKTRPSNFSARLYSTKSNFNSPRLHDLNHSDDPLSQHRSGVSANRSHPAALVRTDVHAVVHHLLLRNAAFSEVSKTQSDERRPLRSALLLNPGSDGRRPARLCPVLRLRQLLARSSFHSCDLARRHVVPRRPFGNDRGRLVHLASTRLEIHGNRRPRMRGCTDWPGTRTHWKLHQRRVVRQTDQCRLGDGISGRRTDPATSVAALRGAARRAGAPHHSSMAIPEEFL